MGRDQKAQKYRIQRRIFYLLRKKKIEISYPNTCRAIAIVIIIVIIVIVIALVLTIGIGIGIVIVCVVIRVTIGNTLGIGIGFVNSGVVSINTAGTDKKRRGCEVPKRGKNVTMNRYNRGKGN